MYGSMYTYIVYFEEVGNLVYFTVEPPNKGSRAFVLFSEVVLWWEVRDNMQFIAPSRPNIPRYNVDSMH